MINIDQLNILKSLFQLLFCMFKQMSQIGEKMNKEQQNIHNEM